MSLQERIVFFFRRVWFYISIPLLIIVSLLFFYNRNKRRDAETRVANAENDRDLAILETKVEQSREALETARQEMLKELNREPTDEELLDRLKKI